MYLKSIELSGFKSFGRKSELIFASPISSVVGPNGSGKSNVAEAFRFVLGEQSMKSMRSKRGEDLIWGGSTALPRANRASVKVTFDNSARLLDIDFKEVVVERVVYRDGQNEYLLNGTAVRLKDIIRLLAGANIGGSGYQIISQGEADRILTASPRERREMVEDALGLKLYQHKKAESMRKLEETTSNVDKTRSLRRELAPHLAFLRREVEKVERARDAREELAYQLNEYLAREHAWIVQETALVSQEAETHKAAVREISAQAAEARAKSSTDSEAQTRTLREKLQAAERGHASARRKSEELARDLGRAEGALEVSVPREIATVGSGRVRDFIGDIEHLLNRSDGSESVHELRSVFSDIRGLLATFSESLHAPVPQAPSQQASERVRELVHALERSQAGESALAGSIEAIRAELASMREAAFAAERDLIAHEAKLREARGKLASAQSARASLAQAQERFEEEVRGGIALVGAAIHSWQRAEIPPGALSEDRSAQEKRRRDIERLKIKLEESGLANADEILKEFKNTKERDEFLAKELNDLEISAQSLQEIIAELDGAIDARFSEGLKLINAALSGFFAKLFGGGEAKLSIDGARKAASAREASAESEYSDMESDSDDDLYAGLSISVALPRKKVRGLEVLSGGERALTSIALIFSMSQVNPPPFLILDETDAALDEANSRRYADMIRELGKSSQLIVITHNRATMAAAGELYGVTMAQDGVSKLLSVKLEEAEKVAK